ncbi:hypothetical protein Poly24_06550 [Rosistilla carotiformis]|uniref:Uncharacterized protein n=1 Tax=Rosistilla carotiformis TaxID=2528017 RepID=A0A518JN31_9BACT|nr:hypothetical protein [Rosistilla carotiformis]QDV66965.1 hypothetical protein Poly24_06550 [Rosistilla carotiformis]
MIGNYFVVSRSILDNVVACDDQTLGLWIRLLSTVNWKRGFFKMLPIEPGQVILCDRQMQERLYPTGTAPAVNTIKRRLEQLKDADLIAIDTLVIHGKAHRVVTVKKWRDYQNTASKIDADSNAESDADSNAESGADRRRKEGKKETTSKAPSDVHRTEQEPSGFSFKIKSASGERWHLPKAKLDEYVATYGNASWVVMELRKARQWCEDNAAKRKTASGMQKFIGGWLARNNDRHSAGALATSHGSYKPIPKPRRAN